MIRLMSFLVGIAVGFVVGTNLMLALDGSELAECAQKHNVFRCEFVTVPKQPDEASP